MAPFFKRILLKISGEAMGGPHGGIDPEAVANASQIIREARAAGAQVAVIIGAGNLFRGLAGSRKGMDRWHRYRRGMEVEIESPRPLYLCVDGEVLCDTRFHIRNLPRAVPFVVPQ